MSGLPSARFFRLPMPSESSPSGLVPTAGGGLPAHDGPLGEEVCSQHGVELGIAAAQPLERHRRVLLLLVAVVREDGPELLVFCRVDALVVPVDGFQLLAQRRGGAVAIDGGRRERRRIFVQSHTGRHRFSSSYFSSSSRMEYSFCRASAM